MMRMIELDVAAQPAAHDAERHLVQLRDRTRYRFRHEATGRMRRIVCFAWFVLWVASACHAPPKPAPAPCLGRRVAVRVQNNTTRPVDVHLYVGLRTTATILGTAEPGLTTFGLPPTDKAEAVRFEARRSNRAIAPAFGNRDEYRRISYEVVCEE